MSSRGEWPFLYRQGDDFSTDPRGRNACGLAAIKRELIYNGFNGGLHKGAHVFDAPTHRAVLEFQQSMRFDLPDGVVGPNTALLLFRKRKLALEHQFGVPGNWLGKIATAESSNDPVAQGMMNPSVEGMMAINLSWYPAISHEEAWDPGWCLNWAATKIIANIEFCGDEEGGVAAYNIGRIYAKQWVDAGKPAEGGPKLGDQDAFARASSYLSVVQASAC